MNRFLLTLALAASATTASAQAAASAGANRPAADTAAVVARPDDVKSVDAIITALYDVISGPAGHKRDWDRFRSLFVPGARLIPTGRRPTGEQVMRVLTPHDYVTNAGSRLEQDGFFEREIGRQTQTFGSIAHVFSAYDSKRTLADSVPFTRGINSIQLLNDGKRWWVVTIFWDSERADNRIPAELLRKP